MPPYDARTSKDRMRQDSEGEAEVRFMPLLLLLLLLLEGEEGEEAREVELGTTSFPPLRDKSIWEEDSVLFIVVPEGEVGEEE